MKNVFLDNLSKEQLHCVKIMTSEPESRGNLPFFIERTYKFFEAIDQYLTLKEGLNEQEKID